MRKAIIDDGEHVHQTGGNRSMRVISFIIREEEPPQLYVTDKELRINQQ